MCEGKGIRFIVLYPPKCSHDLDKPKCVPPKFRSVCPLGSEVNSSREKQSKSVQQNTHIQYTFRSMSCSRLFFVIFYQKEFPMRSCVKLEAFLIQENIVIATRN